MIALPTRFVCCPECWQRAEYRLLENFHWCPHCERPVLTDEWVYDALRDEAIRKDQ